MIVNKGVYVLIGIDATIDLITATKRVSIIEKHVRKFQ